MTEPSVSAAGLVALGLAAGFGLGSLAVVLLTALVAVAAPEVLVAAVAIMAGTAVSVTS